MIPREERAKWQRDCYPSERMYLLCAALDEAEAAKDAAVREAIDIEHARTCMEAQRADRAESEVEEASGELSDLQAAIAEYLPRYEPSLPLLKLAQAWRWWEEEAVRQAKRGDAARAEAIRLDLIDANVGLAYRLERALLSNAAMG